MNRKPLGAFSYDVSFLRVSSSPARAPDSGTTEKGQRGAQTARNRTGVKETARKVCLWEV